ncbi:circadian clock protein KaiC [Bradyrhizobium genosp. L]|uniref:circadian clock protein KaiC n=1 Tax=Bradyrhizobium genosp. L TaxID=83637 RepID=UPI0018A27ACC|nr:circadian clock protein KaiC [Bradyrhizobium genosp. L]QPF83802.1 circadian clock protein KaiC [Bradyrhizobium genosp. L]
MPNRKSSITEPGSSVRLPKTATGIDGLDDLTLGGLPVGRPTLLCGSAGCGKTLFGMTFLVNGATQFDEAGVFMSFEEREQDLAANVHSLGFDLEGLISKKMLAIDYVRIERAEIEESGEYDLEGLFVRLGHAIDTIGAKRVVLDTIEALFSGLADTTILRAELRRLFGWLKEKGVTAIITAERGEGQLTRFGIEEYVSDCVILLDNRVQEQVVTRRLRVVKYRGSAHGTNEYPFLIDDEGISVLPITSAGLSHSISDEAVPTGVEDLDAMLGKGGYYKGSSVLISGLAGTGKSTFGAAFADASCGRGERSLYFAFEESPDQVVRNMRSVGIDLKKHLNSSLLRFEAARPSLFGFEMHLARMNRDIERFRPATIVVDPISAFRGPAAEIHATLVRLADVCKTKGITAVFTSLSGVDDLMSESERSVSSLMDTWISLRDVEADGERNRTLYLLKSRGMSHSKQIREYELADDGIHLTEPYLGPEGVLTGAARMAQEARERETDRERNEQTEQRKRQLMRKREALERQIAEMRAELDAEEEEVSKVVAHQDVRTASAASDRAAMAQKRGASR